MPTPLQTKVDAIQAKVDAQNRAKALQNVANVQNKTELANADNLVKRTGMTTMYNTSSNPPQTPWQQVAAQNLQNKGIDPTKVGTWTGESFQPYQAPVSVPTNITTWTTPSWTTPSPWDDAIWQYDELSPEMKAQLDSDPLAREQFELIAKQWGQTITETVRKTLQSLAELRKQKDFNEEQARINLERMNIQNKAGERQLLQGISDAKSNTFYSSLSSAPSMVANTAAGARIVELGKQFDDFVRLNSLQWDAYTKQVAENARRIQDDLNDKLGKTLAESLQNIDRAIATGEVLTDEQLMKVYKDNKDAMLKAFPTLTNFAVQQMSDLTTNFMNTQKELRARQDIFNQWANQYNAEMSQVQGFAVDGNGNPILNAQGQQIVVPKDAPLPAQFDANTGQLITFSLNENWTIVGNASQIQGYKPPVAAPAKRNVVMVDGKPYDVDQERFLNVWETTGSVTGTVPFTPPTNFSSRGANQSVPVTNTGEGIEIGIPSGTKLEWIGWQCGWLANDYGKGIPWYKPVWNTFESKLANNNSDVPVAGGMVMWTPWKFEDNGHIGIVEKVFADGSFQIYDTNYVAANTTSRRIIKPWDKEYDLIQKTGWFFDPTKVGGQQQDTTKLPILSTKQQARVDKYALDFENEPIVKSFNTVMVQVDAFKNYMQDSSGSSDQAMVYAFAKIMDPDSVVREWEYETVKKYSQGLLARYKWEIEQAATWEWFLSETAKKAMLKTLEEWKLKSLRGSYDNIRNQKIKQINQIVGGDYWDSYLSEYDYGSTDNVPWQNMSTGGTAQPWAFDLDA